MSVGSDQRVRRYFEEVAGEFDAIYDHGGGLSQRVIHRVFRQGMYQRVARTVQECGDVRGKGVLDVGCGSGRVSLALARRGASVLGIDYSQAMIEWATMYLSSADDGALDVEFRHGDFMDLHGERRYDITIALGLFDYIEEPLPFLERMRELTQGILIASYPARFVPQAPIRKVWLRTRGCPVYFYTAGELSRLYSAAGIEDYQTIHVPAGYLVKATVR
ncbi:MAG: methyltransferase domain-containing protein [Chloroflexota bacterium]|nr:methyltransferase domain-containing protein [Chloroflexota bacterium]